MKRLLIIFIGCLMFAACKKESLQQYTEKSRVYLSLRRDSLYSKFPLSTAGNLIIDYAPQKSTKQKDTLRLRIQISGSAANSDRAFVFERNASIGTAKEGTDFDLLDKSFLMPAGKFNTIVRVVVYRNPNMAKQPVTFAYNVKANENFELGPDRDTIGFTNNSAVMNMVALRVTAKDILVKPDNWESYIKTYFGVYSEVKHRFVIDITGLVNFPAATYPVGRMNTFRNTLRTALTKYNTEHPEKLKDENGIEISF
ncbi:DUF4843 domain-containing protein [Pedobacter frigoris]|uniref:DUF4843 domain-containing protein n=1 Tax=Pedobacter frigoris TaxID=2571272 RepID=UPI00292EE789|nr:DUF4843 domain-containing protein [Pedobacter frigoris]